MSKRKKKKPSPAQTRIVCPKCGNRSGLAIFWSGSVLANHEGRTMSGTDGGWIKLHRRFLKSAIWQNPKVARFWTWCLLKATHDGYTTTIGFKRIALEPGQFLYNHPTAVKETLLSQREVRSCLDFLKGGDDAEIGQAKGSLPGNRYSVITINKWGVYQGDNSDAGRQSGINRASKRQANVSLINKEGKNGKKHRGGVGAFDPTESPTWQHWIAACRAVRRKDPAPSPGALQAAKDLSAWVPDLEEQRRIMDAFLGLDDPWVNKQGYQLAVLTKHRFEAVRAITDGTAKNAFVSPSDAYEASPEDVALWEEFERQQARKEIVNG